MNEVMKHVIKSEHEENMKIFLQFNREEKEIMNEMRKKDSEQLDIVHKSSIHAVQVHQGLKKKSSEERSFAVNFNQIRNLISK